MRTSRNWTGTRIERSTATSSGLTASCALRATTPNRYKVSKQADTVMLFFLFTRRGAARDLPDGSGTTTAPIRRQRNIEYYDRRTSHGSTLELRHPRRGSRRHLIRTAPGAVPGRAAERCRRRSGAAPRRKASTPVSCPGRSTSCSAISRAPMCATASYAFRPPARRASSTRLSFLDAVPADRRILSLTLTRDRLDADHAPRGRQPTVPARGSRRASARCAWRPHRVRTQPRHGARTIHPD